MTAGQNEVFQRLKTRVQAINVGFQFRRVLSRDARAAIIRRRRLRIADDGAE